MTEEQWLASRDPSPMLTLLDGKLPARRFWLFGCACCRRLWPLLPDPRERHAVEVGERYADGLADADELRQASNSADRDRHEMPEHYEGSLEEAAAMAAAYVVV